MTERPILFNGEMVRALIDGRKTQTRRIVKPKHACRISGHTSEHVNASSFVAEHSPYGQPGEQLWVREAFGVVDARYPSGPAIIYRATHECTVIGCPCKQTSFWRVSIHMPRSASRITLDVKDVCVERLQEISDPTAEGVDDMEAFRDLWERLNGIYSFSNNPWVWVVSFERST